MRAQWSGSPGTVRDQAIALTDLHHYGAAQRGSSRAYPAHSAK